jgi:HemY protein
MVRILIFLGLIGAAALGATWIAEQNGDISLVWNGWRVQTSLPVFALALGVALLAAMAAWALLREALRLPRRMRRARAERRLSRGRSAISQGLIAIGSGDAAAARRHADLARRLTPQEPLALLLSAQTAQLSGDRAAARQAFTTMAERPDTRLLGLRGLFIEAQRSDDPYGAAAIAAEALKLAPGAAWASHAVLGLYCAQGDWTGALASLERDHASGTLDKASYRRQRAVLLTARAMDEQTSSRDAARTSALDAVKLAPTLVPAAVLAAKFLSEQHQVRRAMRIVEAAWRAHPHPDLADAYAHVRLGDSARQRLARIEQLAAKAPGHVESALAIARAALDAKEFGKARSALAPLIAAPTQRVALLMAEIERGEHGDGGEARAWTMRAVRALHDPAWTADGYVSERWRPVSPVTGRLDAFQWVTPVASLRADGALPIDAGALAAREAGALPPREQRLAPPPAPADAGAPGPAASEAAEPVPAEPAPESPQPVFRPRTDLSRGAMAAAAAAAAIPPVIPLVRPPDDPGVDEDDDADADAAHDESPVTRQAGGVRGFFGRWSR